MDKMKGHVGPSLSSIPATSVGAGFRVHPRPVEPRGE